MTQQYTQPIRNRCPQQLQHTFKRPDGSVIDLTGYVSATLHIKMRGGPDQTFTATILNVSAGLVNYPSWTPTAVGEYNYQFVATDGSGNLLPGEPVHFQVVPNLADLAADKLAEF